MSIRSKSRMASSYLCDAMDTKAAVNRTMPSNSIKKLALVIPTLREADNVRELVMRAVAALEPLQIPFEVLVVDDDSGDGIEAEVAALAVKDSRIRLLVRRGERGLAGAILHGWRHTDATLLAVMDADLQHPPELLPRLVQSVFAGNDVAIGSRYAGREGMRGWHPARKWLSRSAIWATRRLQLAGMPVADPLSGFFVVRRACVEGVEFETRGFKLLLEILVRGQVRTVEEVPFQFGRRVAGRSKAGLRVAVEYLNLLQKLYRERRTAKLPLREAAADQGGL
jgi:dolichol-phosphate mannosyltransferase